MKFFCFFVQPCWLTRAEKLTTAFWKYQLLGAVQIELPLFVWADFLSRYFGILFLRLRGLPPAPKKFKWGIWWGIPICKIKTIRLKIPQILPLQFIAIALNLDSCSFLNRYQNNCHLPLTPVTGVRIPLGSP